MLYPIKFKPILKEMLWGGIKIPQTLNVPFTDETRVGEDFAVSGLASDVSEVANGALKGKNLVALIESYKGDLLGNKVYEQFGTNFPLLIKFIDANNDLSIQVHPNDVQAKEMHNTFGKTEMWYIIDREKGAKLISGLTRQSDKDEMRTMYEEGKIMELMRSTDTTPGDVYFIPAGKVHSIGKGNLIAEIQQTSDITYRLYDFERKDKNGNTRELHLDLGLNAVDYADVETGLVSYENKEEQSVSLVKCRYFNTNKIELAAACSRDYSNLDSFVILINVGGICFVEYDGATESLAAMEAMLIPNSCNNINLKTVSGASLLEVHL